MITASLINERAYPIRATRKARWGSPFFVKVSKGSGFSLKEAQALLQKIAEGLGRAPYRNFIIKRPMKVWFASEREIDELDVKDPGLGIGCYAGRLDAVVIDVNAIKRFDESTLEVLFHEFLHAFSSRSEKKNEMTIFKTGISVEHCLGEDWFLIRREGTILNEGLTEYLRVRAGGAPAQPHYQGLYQTMFHIARWVGERVLFEAYFKNNIELLTSSLDNAYGSGASKYIFAITNKPGLPILSDAKEQELLGFARYGFEISPW